MQINLVNKTILVTQLELQFEHPQKLYFKTFMIRRIENLNKKNDQWIWAGLIEYRFTPFKLILQADMRRKTQQIRRSGQIEYSYLLPC